MLKWGDQSYTNLQLYVKYTNLFSYINCLNCMDNMRFTQCLYFVPFFLIFYVSLIHKSCIWHIAEHLYLGRILLFSGYPSFVVATSWTEVHHKNLSSSSTKNCLDSLNVETGNIYVTEFPPQDQITTQFLFFLLTTFVFVP